MSEPDDVLVCGGCERPADQCECLSELCKICGEENCDGHDCPF